MNIFRDLIANHMFDAVLLVTRHFIFICYQQQSIHEAPVILSVEQIEAFIEDLKCAWKFSLRQSGLFFVAMPVFRECRLLASFVYHGTKSLSASMRGA